MSALDKANWVSQSLMWWAFPFIKHNYYNKPDQNTLTDLPQIVEINPVLERLRETWKQELKKPKPSFFKAILKANLRDMVVMGLPMCLSFLGFLLQAVLIGWILEYLSSDNIPLWEGLVYALSFSLLSFVISTQFSRTGYMFGLIAGRARAAGQLLLYEHGLKITQAAKATGNSASRLVNNVSSDFALFEGIIITVIFPAVPVFVVGSMILIYFYLGVSGVIGILVSILYLPLTILIGSYLKKQRLSIGKCTDSRIKLITNLIEGMRIVKLYGWEEPFFELAKTHRANEIKEYRKKVLLQGISKSAFLCGQGLVLLVTFGIYVALGNELELNGAFAATAILLLAHQFITKNFSLAISLIFTLQAACARIAQTLTLDTIKEDSWKHSKKHSVVLKQANFSWTETKTPQVTEQTLTKELQETNLVLSEVNLKVPKQELVVVVGPVGSGKTSLLLGIMRELNLVSGTLKLGGTLAYCEQDPWINSLSIKDNIIMGKPFDPELFQRVIEACALETDIQNLKFKEETMVGERGVTLSGGQKARISLARAVYSQRDIFLLDDPLSAVDAEVSQVLFQDCIRTFLSEKTVILVTHQSYVVPYADRVVVVDSGRVLFNGTYSELREREDIHELIDQVKDQEEPQENQVKTTNPKSTPKDKLTIKNEEKAEGSVPWRIYGNYFLLGFKSKLVFVVFMVFFGVSQVVYLAITYWLSYWSEQSQSEQENSYYLEVLVLLVVSFYLFGLSRMLILYQCFITSNKQLHNLSLKSVVNTSIKFFDKNPTGRILNRFSGDVIKMDEPLMFFLPDAFQLTFLLFTNFVVIFIVNPVCIVFAVLMALLTVFLVKRIVPMAREFRRIELISRSPVVSYFSNLVSGLTSIRAFGLQSHFAKQVFESVEKNLKAFYSFQIQVRFFQLYMEIMTVCLISVNAVVLIFLKDWISSEAAAVSLVLNNNAFTLISFYARVVVDIDTFMTSVQRIEEYKNLKPEPQPETKEFSVTKGRVEFREVYMKYRSFLEPALKGLSFTIQEGSKVGIVGRTGAGKSSIMQALFRMTKLQSGSILVDNQDIWTAPVNSIRQQMSVIPQTAFLFAATLRENLDPLNVHSDQEILQAVEEVNLKQVVDKIGLTTQIRSESLGLSAGEKQLVCLARAILRKNKVIMMDEATANVDSKTDKFIQQKIKEKFSECTVITVAHRMRTIVKSDLIIVIDDGKVAEAGSPSELVKYNSAFYELIKCTGPSEAKHLLEKINKNS